MGITAGWENFFVAEAGAAAALAGLLFVAVSINLTRILSYAQLPGRAAETLILLLGLLVSALFGLVPGQSSTLLGCELLGVGIVMWGSSVSMQLTTAKDPQNRLSWILTRVVLTQIAAIPMLVAGVELLMNRDGAMYWLVPATILALLAASVNAWILLVEIHR